MLDIMDSKIYIGLDPIFAAVLKQVLAEGDNCDVKTLSLKGVGKSAWVVFQIYGEYLKPWVLAERYVNFSEGIDKLNLNVIYSKAWPGTHVAAMHFELKPT